MSPPALLARYGWNAEWAALAPAGADVGRITRVDRGECDVLTAGGFVRAISDSTRAQGEIAPATGDWVVVGDGPDDKHVIDLVLPRRHTLVRRDPSETVVDQVLVANVDIVLLVHGLDRPLPPGWLERFLVQAWDSGAEPAVVLTKADLTESIDETVGVIAAVAPGVPVLTVRRDTQAGVDELRALVRSGCTAALLGASGVGKSTLVNLLTGADVRATQAVRARDAKGRHTTTARELLLVPGGGAIIDTPGVRAVGVWAGDDDALHRVFADIEALAASCRFTDCAHDREPGCVVRGAVDDRRLARYRALLAELRAVRAPRNAQQSTVRTPGGGRRRGKRG
ncbi:MAG TPA: ribosome small subunit-dependent GTPase A [Acidimicrobiales bacterium]|nr:ribosome small subunit-dependent GTPase A [Acidimicrobiales bacterium]